MYNSKSSIWLLAILFLVVVVIIGVMAAVRIKVSGNALLQASTIQAFDWVRGKGDSKVILVEYSDFQCPACGSYYSIVKKLKEEFGDKITFVYRHFPLISIHSNALLAAVASEAAGQQGKFWEMHDLLFENQKFWSENKTAEEIFLGYAGRLGLDEIKFATALESKTLKSKVEADYAAGLRMGLSYTPTFFLNGKKISNPKSYEEFKQLIGKTLNNE